MTRKGSGLTNQRAWEIWKILGERSQGEYPLCLFKPPSEEKTDPALSDEEREAIRLRGVPMEPREADMEVLLEGIAADRAHADATVQATIERAKRLTAEKADYEADPAPMWDRLTVFMACMAYHNFSLDERIDAEMNQREFRSGIPGVSNDELRCLIRSYWQAVTKQCCTQYGVEFKEIVDWMRERIPGISEEDVKRTADEAIRRGYAEETSFDVIYDYQRRYDIKPAGLAFVHDNDLMSKDARFEGLTAKPPKATTNGAVSLPAALSPSDGISRRYRVMGADPFRESTEARNPVLTGEIWLSAKQLTEKYSLNPATLRRRLKEWREEPVNDSGYHEQDTPRCRDTRFLYLEQAVKPLLDSMSKRTTKRTSKKK